MWSRSWLDGQVSMTFATEYLTDNFIYFSKKIQARRRKKKKVIKNSMRVKKKRERQKKFLFKYSILKNVTTEKSVKN